MEITAAQEDFVRCLLEYEQDWDGFKRVPDSGKYKAKTWQCDRCQPTGLDRAELLGARVAKVIGGELFFGEITEICGFSRRSRQVDERVRELLSQPVEQWRYTVAWPNATSVFKYDEVIKAREEARRVDAVVALAGHLEAAERRRTLDVNAAWHRGYRAGVAASTRDVATRTRYVVPSFGGLLDSLPPGVGPGTGTAAVNVDETRKC